MPPEFAELARPLPATSPRAWRFAALEAANRVGALASDGLRTGYRYGFDSGPFMSYVYANRPAGRTPLGRALDRRLLRRPTCEAFRDIRALAEIAVLDAIDAGGTVLADLAAGPAPYLVRALAQRPDVRAVLCDVDAAALEQARAAAERLGVADRVEVRRADAFSRDSLAALEADVVVELGLYGLFHDDEKIARHFHDLAELVGPRQIVLNVQTRNPEIEYIARVWRNGAGERCVWRLRPVEQILGYAAEAGYEPASVTADRHGIYRVARLVRG
jgi:precorrin-6B methylase 2